MYLRFVLLGVLLYCVSCQSAPKGPETDALDIEEAMADADAGLSEYPETPEGFENLPVSSFGEIWAYLISGQEQALKAGYPISDIGYFGAEIDSYGQLVDVPNPRKIAPFPGRIHLVVTCDSRGLTHFILEPGSRARRQLVADLLEAARPYNGLQIDFELVPQRDGDAFRSFLAELRSGLGEKLLTIALPARTRTLEDDRYDYRKILPLVDRILVMAYDEHWSTSEPGPIASMNWSQSVASYAIQTIGPEKLVMGLPFYGRTWGNVNPSRAFFHSGIERIKNEQGITEIRRENGIPTFSYEVPLTITAYYEDEYSLSARLDMYRTMGVRAAGFWRLGQETPLIWELLRLDGEAP
jgi:hypothetical protein